MFTTVPLNLLLPIDKYRDYTKKRQVLLLFIFTVSDLFFRFLKKITYNFSKCPKKHNRLTVKEEPMSCLISERFGGGLF